ncbi:MAG: hypothetical protein Q4D50_00025 [Eubacteriales bacterium]|nr:hypothetical protein [Eubacteriales bacterium]
MKAILDDSGFITSFALEGEITDGIELPDPEDIDHFIEHWQSYKAQDGKALFDEEQDTAHQEESEKETLRQRRQTECFTFVNRGQLWYATLSIKQLAELTAWYTAWLKVTETKTIPEKPEWLE